MPHASACQRPSFGEADAASTGDGTLTSTDAVRSGINRGWAPLTGVIHGSEKYIDLPIAELYDLPKDPRELNNLREERHANRLRSVLGQLVESARQLA